MNGISTHILIAAPVHIAERTINPWAYIERSAAKRKSIAAEMNTDLFKSASFASENRVFESAVIANSPETNQKPGMMERTRSVLGLKIRSAATGSRK